MKALTQSVDVGAGGMPRMLDSVARNQNSGVHLPNLPISQSGAQSPVKMHKISKTIQGSPERSISPRE